jgi:hypothetical protein
VSIALTLSILSFAKIRFFAASISLDFVSSAMVPMVGRKQIMAAAKKPAAKPAAKKAAAKPAAKGAKKK